MAVHTGSRQPHPMRWCRAALEGGVNEDFALCVETTATREKPPRSTSGRKADEERASSARSWKGARKAPGCSPTYRGVGVGAEYGVLPDDAVQLERGQPGHEDHGG